MDEHQSSAPPRGPGRKACISCARMKCKCIPRADDSSCERCYRLQKDCVPSAPAKPRGPKRHVAPRTTRLEEKLDDLVSLLRAQQGPGPTNRSETGEDPSENGSSGSRGDTFPSTVMTPASGETYCDEPLPIEATESLRRFREEMIPLSPYIYLPPDMTALQLRDMYPFLWLNVMCVASPSATRRRSLGKQAREIIIQKVVVDGERSLDLLFGVLTYVNWAHLFRMDIHFSCLVSQLAATLIWDLGLQMPPPKHLVRFCYPPRIPTTQQSGRNARTDDERRAVLGAFIITSRVSQSFKAADGLRWSPHLDDYLSFLSHHSTLAQDKILVAQVRMQLITNQIHSSWWKTSPVEVPLPYVDALQSQLDEIAVVNGTSIADDNNPMMLALYHFTALIIRESAIVKPPTSRTEPALQRYEVYRCLLTSIKAWLDAFFSLSLDMYSRMPCTIFPQLAYVICCLHHITTVKDTAWNSAATHEVVDLIPTLDRIINLFDQLRSPDSADDDPITFAWKKFNAMKMAWQSEMVIRNRDDDANHEVGMVDSTQGLLSPGFSLTHFDHDMLPDVLDFSW